MENIIGRVTELAQLSKIVQSNDAELLAVYGRRRVGKTFLIRNAYEKRMIFEFSGIHNASLAQQLENFRDSLSKMSKGTIITKPTSWIQAFNILIEYLTPLIKTQKKVIFFDELPWINTPRSGFLPAFENFWNSWAARQKNIVVVICGSSASWMIQKIVKSRGGLHNRVTRKIRLLPFTVGETEAFLKSRMVILDKYQILQLYMVMGGIPQYLKEFEHAQNHMKVIRALAKNKSGLSRSEIIEACSLTSGGGATQLLDELTESGFITPYIPFNRTAKDNIYKLTDEYSLFYLKYIENSKSHGPGTWAKFSTGNSWTSWSGFAFESICMKHSVQIKKALGIENVSTEMSVWQCKPQKGEQGAQIDLLIDRQDQCINLCEMKFSVNSFIISKSYAKELESKLKVFREQSKTRKTLFLTLVTTYGVKNGNSFTGLIQNEVTMDALF
jgi:AAA+ ATPase superfamily predicted ATPase